MVEWLPAILGREEMEPASNATERAFRYAVIQLTLSFSAQSI